MKRLDELQCLFWSRHSPLQVVRWLADEGTLDDAVQQEVLELVLRDDPLLSACPLEDSYLRQLLKHLIDAVETQHQDVNEELVELYSSLLLGGGDKQRNKGGVHANQWSVKTFCWALEPYGLVLQLGNNIIQQHAARLSAAAPDKENSSGSENIQDRSSSQLTVTETDVGKHSTECNDKPTLKTALATCANSRPAGLLSLRVSSNMLAGGTGCSEWEAGLVLAEVLMSHPHLVAGKSCLELGCGCGAVGIAAAFAGASQLLMTDGSLETVDNCCFNCNVLNGIPTGKWATGTRPWSNESSNRVLCGVLKWEEADNQLCSWQPQVVLGADLLYDPVAIPYLVDLVQQLCCAGDETSHLFEEDDSPNCWSYASTHQTARTAAEHQSSSAVADRCKKQGKKKMHSQDSTVVYLATTRRNEATLQLFLSTVAASKLECMDVTESLVNSSAESDLCKMCNNVRFQHLPWLTDARPRILLHRIQRRKQ